jgi:hypothetical protein
MAYILIPYESETVRNVLLKRSVYLAKPWVRVRKQRLCEAEWGR